MGYSKRIVAALATALVVALGATGPALTGPQVVSAVGGSHCC